MNKFSFLFLFFFVASFSKVFAQEIIDTMPTSRGDIVIFEDHSWEYLEDLNFDGIMNHHLNELILENESLSLIQTWDHDVCYTSAHANDLSKLSDTLWMCVVEDIEKDFVMPVKGLVTSRYGPRGGRYHQGIDLDLETGDTVVSAWSGKVRYAKFNDGGFGNLVIVRHDNGLETFYAHLDKIMVYPNQVVEAGEVLGLGGNTGHSRGSHLHFEVRFYDAPMNPEQVIDFEHKKCKDENLLVHRGLFQPGAKPVDMYGNVTSSTASSASPSASTKKFYKVRSGDTLSAIAAKNRTTVSKICTLNGIRPTTILQVGRSLRVR